MQHCGALCTPHQTALALCFSCPLHHLLRQWLQRGHFHAGAHTSTSKPSSPAAARVGVGPVVRHRSELGAKRMALFWPCPRLLVPHTHERHWCHPLRCNRQVDNVCCSSSAPRANHTRWPSAPASHLPSRPSTAFPSSGRFSRRHGAQRCRCLSRRFFGYHHRSAALPIGCRGHVRAAICEVIPIYLPPLVVETDRSFPLATTNATWQWALSSATIRAHPRGRWG